MSDELEVGQFVTVDHYLPGHDTFVAAAGFMSMSTPKLMPQRSWIGDVFEVTAIDGDFVAVKYDKSYGDGWNTKSFDLRTLVLRVLSGEYINAMKGSDGEDKVCDTVTDEQHECESVAGSEDRGVRTGAEGREAAMARLALVLAPPPARPGLSQGGGAPDPGLRRRVTDSSRSGCGASASTTGWDRRSRRR